MRRNLKRGLATLLSAMMVITAAPATSVFAVESQQQEGWSDDGYYYYFDEDGETLLEEKGKPTEVAATCSENAKTIYTSEHGGEFTVEKPDTKLAHTPAKAVKENETPATCTEEGKYEEVVYCDVCGEEISREEKKSDALGHVALDPVEEKNAKTAENPHCYDMVVYCDRCGEELSREPFEDAHNWVKKEVTKEPVCGESDGEELWECSICGETETRTIEAAPAHTKADPVQENVKAATCTEDGSYDAVVYCATCGKEISRESVTVKAAGHKEKEGTSKVVKEASCGEAGSRTYTCEACKQTITEEIPATGEHAKTELRIIRDSSFTAATCTEDAHFYVAPFCLKCGKQAGEKEYYEGSYDLPDEVLAKEAKPEELNAKGHDWEVTEVRKAGDCKTGTDEIVDLKCKICGEVKENVTREKAHVWGEEVREHEIPATCGENQEPGSYERVHYCTVCNTRELIETVTGLKKDHEWYYKNKKDQPKCDVVDEDGNMTESGAGIMHCKNCEDTKEVESLGPHDWVRQKDAGYEPTCLGEKPGKYFFKCSKCGEIDVRIINLEEDQKKAHVAGTPVKENVKNATCTAAGSYEEVVYCKVCNYELSRETKEIEALGHSVTPPATAKCGEEFTAKCSRCKQDVTQVLEHDYKQEALVVAPTCTTPGQAYVVCSRCGDRKFADGKTEEDEHTDAIPALGHNFDYTNPDSAVVHWDAENPDRGYVVYTFICKNDASHKEDKIVNFFAGEEGATYTVTGKKTDPTCTADGKIVYTFDETLPNGKKVTSTNPKAEVVDKLGHKWVKSEENRVEPTCTKDGSFESAERCSICGIEKTTKDDKNYKREKVVLPKLDHVKGEPVIEKFDEGSDTKERYDTVVYCKNCGKELERTPHYVAKGHVPGEYVLDREASTEPTCTKYGKAVWVSHCLNDGEELDRYEQTINPLSHLWHDGKKEVIEEGDCTKPEKYYWYWECETCGLKVYETDSIHDPLQADHVGNVYKETRVEDRKVLEGDALGHKGFYTKTLVTKPATCTENGSSVDVTYCGICFEEVSRAAKENVIPATGHVAAAPVSENVVAPAAGKAGSYDEVVYCSVCGEELSRKTIKVEALPLPTPTPTLTPTPTPAPVPAPVVANGNVNSNLKGTQTGKKLKVTWGKVANADGYDVYVQYCGKSFKAPVKTYTTANKTSVTLKKLNGKKINTKKAIKLYVVAWKFVDGKKVDLSKSLIAHVAGKDHAMTNAKSVSVSGSTSLSATGSTTLSATMKLAAKGKKLLNHVKKFRFVSSNPAVAKVSSTGKVTAVSKGSCTIYVLATNGIMKRLNITVA